MEICIEIYMDNLDFFILDLEIELPMFSKIKAVSEIKGSFSLCTMGYFGFSDF